MNGRILAVDPGEKRIGIAISDPTGTIARALTVIKHVSMQADCTEISRLAVENEAAKIIIGEAVGDEDETTPQMRHARKMADVLLQESGAMVELWDESSSTQIARQARIAMNVNRKKRSGHMDDLAAVVILQDYLDWLNDQRQTKDY